MCLCRRNSSSERLLLPKNEGVIGIIDTHNLHKRQLKSCITSTTRKIPPTCVELCDTDVINRTVNVHDPVPQQNENIGTMQERITI
jgi:hypothetical protein